MADELKPGDVVTLKSGGPLMTIEKRETDGRFWCTWFNEKKQPDGRYFEEVLLRRANPD